VVVVIAVESFVVVVVVLLDSCAWVLTWEVVAAAVATVVVVVAVMVIVPVAVATPAVAVATAAVANAATAMDDTPIPPSSVTTPFVAAAAGVEYHTLPSLSLHYPHFDHHQYSILMIVVQMLWLTWVVQMDGVHHFVVVDLDGIVVGWSDGLWLFRCWCGVDRVVDLDYWVVVVVVVG